MYLNRVQLIGNITKEIELKALPSGMSVASFSVATNRTIKDSNGNKKETAEFHNCVSFGKTAELIHQYMKKGNQIFIEGRLQTRSWDGQDGKKLYRTEVIVDQMQFGNNPKAEGSSSYSKPAAPAPQEEESAYPDFDEGNKEKPALSKPAKAPTPEVEYPDDDINPEDIPF